MINQTNALNVMSKMALLWMELNVSALEVSISVVINAFPVLKLFQAVNNALIKKLVLHAIARKCSFLNLTQIINAIALPNGLFTMENALNAQLSQAASPVLILTLAHNVTKVLIFN